MGDLSCDMDGFLGWRFTGYDIYIFTCVRRFGLAWRLLWRKMSREWVGSLSYCVPLGGIGRNVLRMYCDYLGHVHVRFFYHAYVKLTRSRGEVSW